MDRLKPYAKAAVAVAGFVVVAGSQVLAGSIDVGALLAAGAAALTALGVYSVRNA